MPTESKKAAQSNGFDSMVYSRRKPRPATDLSVRKLRQMNWEPVWMRSAAMVKPENLCRNVRFTCSVRLSHRGNQPLLVPLIN